MTFLRLKSKTATPLNMHETFSSLWSSWKVQLMLTSWEDKCYRANLFFVVESLTLQITIAKEKMIQTAYWLKDENKLKNKNFVFKGFWKIFLWQNRCYLQKSSIGKIFYDFFYVVSVWIKEVKKRVTKSYYYKISFCNFFFHLFDSNANNFKMENHIRFFKMVLDLSWKNLSKYCILFFFISCSVSFF